MENIVWNEQYNINVEVVDNAHAKLFRIVNRLTELAKDESTSRLACQEGIKYLESYTMKHFSEEEAYMRSVRYQGYTWHKKIHDDFRDKTLVSLRRDLQLSDYSPAATEHFLGIMMGWLTGHIMTEDQAIVGKNVPQKLYDPSSKISIIAKAVNRAMLDVFQLDSRLLQARYKGQSIGSALYCRLLYDIDNGGKVQLLLGIEEQLILKGVGKVMTVPPSQRDTMVNMAAVQIFKQLFHHMGKLFRSETIYEISATDLLSKDEFRADFMKGYPCCLLFDTRVGYFIFCLRAWKEKKLPFTP